MLPHDDNKTIGTILYHKADEHEPRIILQLRPHLLFDELLDNFVTFALACGYGMETINRYINVADIAYTARTDIGEDDE